MYYYYPKQHRQQSQREFLLPDHKIKTHHVVENEDELIAEIPLTSQYLTERKKIHPQYDRLDVVCEGKKYENVPYRIDDNRQAICVQKKHLSKKQYYNSDSEEEEEDSENESEIDDKKEEEKTSIVVQLTSKNFDKIVMDPTKDIMVKFYAPWCGHCIHLAPIYEEVAKKHERKDVIVAEIDATKYGDIAKKYKIRGFPTIKWFGKGRKESPMDYTSERSESGFIRFITNNNNRK